MELRVESAEGFNMPPGCFVGVRVGDVLKQGRYEPQRCYHFPKVERRRNAKIDVYRHVGSCIVAVDPDAKTLHEVNVSSLDPSIAEMKLKVNVQSAVMDSGKQRETKTKAVRNQAKDYLAKYNIEEQLSEAVKALLKEQPTNPTEFLCRHLRGGNDEPEKFPKATCGAPASTSLAKPATLLPFRGYYKAAVGPAAPPSSWASLHAKFPRSAAPSSASRLGPMPANIQGLREQARDVLMKACVDGSLNGAMTEVRVGLTAGVNKFALQPSVGTWISCSPKGIKTTPTSGQTSFSKMASVGTWLAPMHVDKDPPPRRKHLLPSQIRLGAAGFAKFNMRPHFTVI